MIRPLAGWLPLILLAASSAALLWWFGRETDPHRRYIDDLARANRRLDRSTR